MIRAIAAAFAYGAAMGSFGGKPLQALVSGVKVPLLLATATVVCLPAFFALNSVLGLRRDFGASLRAVLAAQATLATALASLAPVTLFFYVSGATYPWAVLGNGACFALSTAAARTTLQRHYRPLLRRDRRHAVARAAWTVLYVFVAVQAAWMLRPFVGSPGLPTRFFRDGGWDNAYVVVARTVVRVLSNG